jgi:iron complex outermembrane recepter protein
MALRSAALAPVLLSGNVLAAEESSALEEVIVTAQFREERLQETPIAITAVTEEMMRARGQDSIFEVTQQAPNVQIKKNSGPFGASTSAFIRGIGQGDFNFALEPGVGMYIDDIYFPTMTGSAFEIVDLERVEVLRGPQGTLQGRNAIGGSVRLITKKPTGSGDGYAEVTAGRFNRIGAKGAADLELGENLFLRITGAANSQDGYVERRDFACDQPAVAASLGITSSGIGDKGCKLGTLGGQSFTAARANLRWVATEDLELNLVADLTNDRSEANAMVLLNAQNIASLGPAWGPWFNVKKDGYYTYETFGNTTSGPNAFVGFNRTPWATPPINHMQAWGTALTVDYRLSETLSLKSISSYREIANDFATANDGSPISGETAFNELNGHSFQEELRLNGTAGPLDYTLGLFYFTQKNQNRNRVDIGYIFGPGNFDFVSDEVADSESKAAFVHTVWHVTDQFNVTAGVRYSDEEKDQLLGRLNSGDGGRTPTELCVFKFTAAIPACFGAPSSLSALYLNGGFAPVVTFADERFDYRLSLDYQFTDSFMMYATHSTGFKSGGVSPRFFFTTHILPFDVEELKAYELGFKSDMLGRTLRINGAIFLSDYTDQQTGAPGSVCPGLVPASPCLATVNGQDSEYKGAELEVTWNPLDDLAIDLSGSWIDAKYTRIDPLVLANPNFIRDPDGPVGIPQYKYSLGVQYGFTLGSGAKLTPRVDYNYEAKRSPAVRNATTTPSSKVVNARVAWTSSERNWELALAVNNATDEYYYYNIFDISTFGGWTAAQPAPPREWAFTIRRNF